MADDLVDPKAKPRRFSIKDLISTSNSNLDVDELMLYTFTIILASIHMSLIIRYFLRLRVYFDRLQREIRKTFEQY